MRCNIPQRCARYFVLWLSEMRHYLAHGDEVSVTSGRHHLPHTHQRYYLPHGTRSEVHSTEGYLLLSIP